MQDLSLLAVVTAMVQDGVIIVGDLIVVIVQRGLILFDWIGSGSGLVCCRLRGACECAI